MSRADPQINIRVPIELKKEIEHAAIENSRSLNAEVVHRLQDSLSRGKVSKSELTTEELMEELSKRFGGLQVSISPLNEKK
ncbi:Arc family DNA-binding protein [Acinetobacter nosocomialis]|uniref:Arc family DNA-binding protein n=1 Tax=Acinetobacter calcoaceticus/baumannii complex TaxID=909768 RepID=UPI0004486851|nr:MULTISPECIES: Arc family DNA-binding protein [Acinetobacter calcoaceticus/baumannii complex]EXR27115.1 arc-like DNA binding domain protein [Acinetobacter sp. 1281984]MDB0300237.1 Arc family DNA-binding protein [Acinetobacter baumannii]MDC9816712.1 Arc family DNA-binding protein [Acinetobacter nosocomialis]MDE9406026.1 Arc family DNA-binding protein [Acinetobacter nosocomialis]MDO7201915.1 Arc family DNA-binding protein [Acinetobacter baumannii]